MRASEGQELSDGGGGAERGPALKRRRPRGDITPVANSSSDKHTHSLTLTRIEALSLSSEREYLGEEGEPIAARSHSPDEYTVNREFGLDEDGASVKRDSV